MRLNVLNILKLLRVCLAVSVSAVMNLCVEWGRDDKRYYRNYSIYCMLIAIRFSRARMGKTMVLTIHRDVV